MITNTVFIFKKRIFFSALLILYNTICLAGNWSLGAGALLSENAYRETAINRLIIPFISFQGRYLSVYGPFAKLRYPINKKSTVGAALQLGLQDYDPNESRNAQMKLLNERERLFYLGPFYRYKTDYGDIIANASADVTGRSNGGLFANIRYSYAIKEATMKYYIRPAVGIVWNNKKLNQHFYQVSQTDSANSGFNIYSPNSTFAPFGSIFAGIRISKRLYWTNIANLSYIPNTISNSPMSSGSHVSYNIITGLTFEIGEKKQRFNH